eukprot:4869252-Prorocentrum_lima.AAC.1
MCCIVGRSTEHWLGQHGGWSRALATRRGIWQAKDWGWQWPRLCPAGLLALHHRMLAGTSLANSLVLSNVAGR